MQGDLQNFLLLESLKIEKNWGFLEKKLKCLKFELKTKILENWTILLFYF